MTEVTREQLHAYLDEHLTDSESARIEQAIRESPELKQRLRQAMQERDRGEHSLGAVWRREHLSCPTREQLGGYLLQVLDPELHEYIQFHLTTVSCPFCRANLADLQSRQAEPTEQAQTRRQKYFQSSAGLVPKRRG